MQTTLENLGQLERRLNVAVPLDEIEGEVQKRLSRLAKTVKMAGFRPGHVPLKVVAQQYGPQVRSDVISDAVRKGFDDRSYLQRYTPRGRRSTWSRINVDNVARLIAEGRMTQHGLLHVDAAKQIFVSGNVIEIGEGEIWLP